MRRRTLCLALLLLAPPALAHHGVFFTRDAQIRIEGPVVKTLTGNPHFEIWVQDGDTRWEIDLGNPYRIERAGLAWDGSDMPLGRRIVVEGFPSVTGTMLEARTIWIGDEPHRLFDEDEPKY